MVKRTGNPILRLFYLIGRPVFYLLLGVGYLVLVAFSLLKNSIFLISASIRYLVISLSRLTWKFINKVKPQKKPKFYFIKVKVPKVKISLPQFKLRLGAKFIAFTLSMLPALYLLFTIYNLLFTNLPSPKILAQPLPLTTKIFDRNGELLYKIYRDQNRTKIKLADIPLTVRQATIAIEDKDFYKHPGISFRGIARAVYFLVFKNKVTGGSTITQQLVKNTLLTPEKTLKRKIREIVLSLLVEKKYTKDEILEMYLNEVGYGGAAYGIEEASQKHFGKSVKDLNLAEIALLAGLPASPTAYSPFGSHPEVAKLRQTEVLRRMTEDGYITEQESKRAGEQELKIVPQETEIQAPHFVMYVKEILAQKYGERVVEEGGLNVITSLDLGVQEMAQKIVKEEITKLKPLRISNGAALVTNPKTGEILAMVGSKDYNASDIDGNFNVTTALRQPGSAIKPVNYSIALERGFTLATLIEDSPITYKVPGQPPYTPKNYDGRFHGNIPLKVALGSSYNVPAVKVLAAFGVSEMVKRGNLLGITTWDDPSKFGLSLTLGGGEVKMVDLATVYGTLANLGQKVNLKPILIITDNSGKILEEENCLQEYLGEKLMKLHELTPVESSPPASAERNPAEAPSEDEGRRRINFSQILQREIQASDQPACTNQVLNPGVAYLLTNILSDNSARTPAFGPNSQLVIPGHEVAVKTGTTTNMRDNWTIGYTPSFLVAAWVGNNDNTPMSYVASGVTGASPIWNKIISQLLKDKPNEPFKIPEEVISVQICSLTGTLTCEGCPSVKTEYFLKGTEPKTHCDSGKVKQILEEKIRLEEEQKKQGKPEG